MNDVGRSDHDDLRADSDWRTASRSPASGEGIEPISHDLEDNRQRLAIYRVRRQSSRTSTCPKRRALEVFTARAVPRRPGAQRGSSSHLSA